MIQVNIQLTAEQRSLILGLLKKYLGTSSYRVFLFGSRAKGTARANSDLDLMIDTHKGLGPIRSELNEAFEKSDLPFKVDLVEKIELTDAFRKNIQSSLVELEVK